LKFSGFWDSLNIKPFKQKKNGKSANNEQFNAKKTLNISLICGHLKVKPAGYKRFWHEPFNYNTLKFSINWLIAGDFPKNQLIANNWQKLEKCQPKVDQD
jgi:hypothetical protein